MVLMTNALDPKPVYGIEGVINIERALKSLRETIGLNPDFVYNPGGTGTCVYARLKDELAPRPLNDDEYAPSCAVGQGIAHEGGTVQLLLQMDNGDFGQVGELHREGLPMTWGAAQVYAQAQAVQDGGDTWGEALAAAERRALSITDDEPPTCGDCDEYLPDCDCRVDPYA